MTDQWNVKQGGKILDLEGPRLGKKILKADKFVRKGIPMWTRINPIIACFTLSFILATASVQAAELYVDSDSPGAQTGTSWNSAYHYLQDALSVAQYGDTIKVGQGTYTPSQAISPAGLGRLSTFQLKSGVAIEGGYVGYSNSLPSWQWDNRDVLLYATILSGDLGVNDAVLDPNDTTLLMQMNGSGSRQDNCYNIITASYVDRTAVLDGFIIQGGNANGEGTSALLIANGGGILANAASPTIRDCVIVNCSATENGGGIYMQAGSEPNIVDCTFRANYSDSYGGALVSSVSEPNIHGCMFDRNVVKEDASRRGGAIYCVDSRLTMEGSSFYSNQGAQYGGAFASDNSNVQVSGTSFSYNYSKFRGGAIHLDSASYGRFVNCRFISNASRYHGGALNNDEGSVELIQCSFLANMAEHGHGGAIYSEDGDPNIVNCVFNGNNCDDRGGGICFNESTGLISSCTFSANNANSGEAFACFSSNSNPKPSNVTVHNSILWDSGNEIYNGDSSSITVAYSAIQGGYAGTDNKSYYPNFVDYRGVDKIAGTEDDDLRLSASSGYIDSGNNHLVPWYLVEDLIHMPRFIDDFDTTDSGVGTAPIIDRGAYEYGDPESLAPPIADAGEDIAAAADAQGYATVMLDGTGSYDPDGDPLQYLWSWTLNQQPHTTTTARPSLTLPVGQVVIELVVFDGINYSEPDTVQVTVVSTGQPPTADAGDDQSLTLTSGTTVNVQLNGSGSTDPDGDPLQYTWTWLVGSTPHQSIGITPQIQLPLGTYIITLVVYDGIYYSSEDTVTIRVKGQNRQPVADAGDDQTVSAPSGGSASVTLNGSGSYDPDGDPLTYTWQWIANSTLKQASGVSPSITLPVGQFLVSLVVSDGLLSSSTDTVTITVNEVSNQAPIANAGADRTVTASGSTANVTLNGSGSYDPDGSITQYLWTWASGSATGVNPTVSLAVGTHIISLVVFDGTDYSTADTVVITVSQGNQAPIANAGADRTVVTSGSTVNVTLDGSGSYDPDGSIVQYFWSWSGGSATGVNPTISLAIGTHTISLIVYDGNKYSTVDTVVITVTLTNQAPVANAGSDQTVAASGSTANVTLDGSGSYDPDGSITQYIWTWASGSASGAHPSVNLPVGTHTISLIVYDGTAYSSADYVVITVTQTNQKPVANAGSDRTVILSSGTTVSVTLDGSGSYDPESASLSYIWTYTIGTVTYSRTGVNPTVQLPVGSHSIKLVVFDGSKWSDADYVVITVTQVNQAPVANAGEDQSVTTSGATASVTLDGSGSYDSDGAITQYIWTWSSGSTSGMSPTITLGLGTHTISLIVYDGSKYSSADYVSVTVSHAAQAPVADAGEDQTVTVASGENASVTLDGSGSYDPDGGTLTFYYWTWTVGSESQTAYGVNPVIELPVGTHTISLTVFDGSDTSEVDTVTITVVEESGSNITLLTYPSIVNRTDTSTYLLMFLTLPDTDAVTINENFPLLLYPGGDQSDQLHVVQQDDGSTMIFAMFDEEELLNSIPGNGNVELTIFGQYIDSNLFDATTTVTLVH